MSDTALAEINQGDRFSFGANWSKFLRVLDDDRIREAERSLTNMLGVDTLAGRTFLDVGSGSGLFSLAARRLGARVFSFDFDPQSVACAVELRSRYFAGDPDWTIEQGSVLDEAYMAALATFDIVYSWGVLHHTGQMWRALENVAPRVAPGGNLFIAIYNDQGPMSRIWSSVKRTYNRLPGPLKLPYAVGVMGPRELRSLAFATVRGAPGDYVRSWTGYKSARGMSRWHDIIDWVGGHPFEVARPEEILAFYRQRHFELARMKTCGGGLGCNEFVFRAAGTAR